MTRSTFVEPAESGPALSTIGRAGRRAGWGAAAAAAAALGCAAGLAAGWRLPWRVGDWAPMLDGGVGQATLLMAALGGAIGLAAGGAAGLALGGPRRLAAGLTRPVVGSRRALAGGLGPVLGVLTAGRLPAEAAAVLACGVSALAGLVGSPAPAGRTGQAGRTVGERLAGRTGSRRPPDARSPPRPGWRRPARSSAWGRSWGLGGLLGRGDRRRTLPGRLADAGCRAARSGSDLGPGRPGAALRALRRQLRALKRQVRDQAATEPASAPGRGGGQRWN